MLLHQVSEYTKLIVEAKDKHLAKLNWKLGNLDTAQWSLVKNASTLPNPEYKTDDLLDYFKINENDILSIIKNLNASKAHGRNK